MKSRMLLAVLLLSATVAFGQERREPPKGTRGMIAGRVLVKVTREAFTQGPSASMFGAAASEFALGKIAPWLRPELVRFRLPMYKGGSTTEAPALALRRIMVVEYGSGASPVEVARALNGMPGVEYAEPIYIRRPLYTPNDPHLDKQWYLDLIKAPEAWDIARADSTILVAVTDTGVELDHEDLKDAIWKNSGETGPDGAGGDRATNGKDDDGNGYIDDYRGYDFSGADGRTPDNDPTPRDNHGTLVSGLVVATGNNDKGIVGIGHGARLMPLKVADEYTDPEINTGFEGILYAAKMGAHIINCSWGDDNWSRAEQEILDVVHRDYNVMVIAAAGNGGSAEPIYPASYRGVFSIAATGQFDEKASFSRFNYAVDLAAPGVQIYSTTIANRYASDGGTSFSCPIVAGGAAVIKKHFPSLTGREIEEVLRANSDDISASLDPVHADKLGSGRLNLLRALTVGPNIASARVIDYTVIDASGDGIADAGEKITIRTSVKNMLAAAPSVSVVMDPISYPPLVIENANFELGAMISGQTTILPDGSFSFTVPDLSPNMELVLRISVTTKDRTNLEFIKVRVSPTYATTDHNKLAVTFNSTGNLAFDGFNTQEGDGFTYGASKNLLFHGGFIAGVGPNQVSDVIRNGGFTQGSANGFQIVAPYRLTLANDSSVEIGTARFDDRHRAGASNVGIEVDMTTREYRDSALSNIVLVNYHLRNISGQNLAGLHAGIYLDWDIGINGTRDNVTFDAERRMGFQRNVDAQPGFVAAAALLSKQAIDFFAFDNDDDVNGVNDFPMPKKWAALSGGVRRPNSNIGDVSMMIGGGPVSLGIEDSADFTFALVVAENFQELQKSVDKARQVFGGIGTGVETPEEIAAALQVRISPSPMRGATDFSCRIPETGPVLIRLYDLQGRPVRTLFNGEAGAGELRIMLNADDLPDGVYIYSVRTEDFSQQGKVVKVGE